MPGVAAAGTVQVVVPPAVVGLLNAEPTAASAGPPRCPWVTPNTGRWSKQIMRFMVIFGKVKTK